MQKQHPEIERYLATQPVFNSDHLARFFLGDFAVGWVEPETAKVLTAFDQRFQTTGSQFKLSANPIDFESIMLRAALHLRELGLIKVWRDEDYAVHPQNQQGEMDCSQSLFKLERGAFRRFGMCSQASHINGITADCSLWLARRAPTKGIDPNRLDNIAAGGIPYDETAAQCAVRELIEEAGLQASHYQQLRYVEQIRSLRNEVDGTHNEILHCFDVQLLPSSQPCNQDGEVAEFIQVSAEQAIALLPEMTWDAGLVTARYLLRSTD